MVEVVPAAAFDTVTVPPLMVKLPLPNNGPTTGTLRLPGAAPPAAVSKEFNSSQLVLPDFPISTKISAPTNLKRGTATSPNINGSKSTSAISTFAFNMSFFDPHLAFSRRMPLATMRGGREILKSIGPSIFSRRPATRITSS